MPRCKPCWLIYGTLLPFDLDVSRFVEQLPVLGAWLWSPVWIMGSASFSWPGLTSGLGDLVLNRLLYVPFGFPLRIAIWRPDRPAWRQVLQVMLIVASTSWLLECSQSLSSTRFVPLSDFFANTLTGMLAAIAAIRIRLATRATPGHGLLVLPRDRPMSWAEPRVRPTVLIGAVLLGVSLVGSRDLLTRPTGLTAQVNWLPFADHFRRSY